MSMFSNGGSELAAEEIKAKVEELEKTPISRAEMANQLKDLCDSIIKASQSGWY